MVIAAIVAVSGKFPNDRQTAATVMQHSREAETKQKRAGLEGTAHMDAGRSLDHGLQSTAQIGSWDGRVGREPLPYLAASKARARPLRLLWAGGRGPSSHAARGRRQGRKGWQRCAFVRHGSWLLRQLVRCSTDIAFSCRVLRQYERGMLSAGRALCADARDGRRGSVRGGDPGAVPSYVVHVRARRFCAEGAMRERRPRQGPRRRTGGCGTPTSTARPELPAKARADGGTFCEGALAEMGKMQWKHGELVRRTSLPAVDAKGDRYAAPSYHGQPVRLGKSPLCCCKGRQRGEIRTGASPSLALPNKAATQNHERTAHAGPEHIADRTTRQPSNRTARAATQRGVSHIAIKQGAEKTQ